MAQFLKLEKFLHYFCLGLVAVIALTIVSALVLSFYLNFKVDRRNLTKESPYPSVSLCQVFNDDKLAEISKALYGDNKLNDYLTEIAFFTGSCYSCEQCETELKCPNLTEIISNFRVQCNGLVQNCSWNDKKFDCCKSFMPLETESGICYSINSALAYHNKDKEPISHKHNFGKLRMEVLVDIQLFIHHPKDVPYTYQRRDLRDTILLVCIIIYIKRALIIQSKF